MKISDKILNIWTKNHSRGDVSRLIDYTKASKPTIIKAIRHGRANSEIILKISEYYSEKKQVLPEDIENKALKMFNNGKSENH